METERIMVVDDDRELVELLAFALKRAGFDVLTAYNAEDAMALLEQAPHLAVIDLNLGAQDGYDLLKDLREQVAFPVLILSGRNHEEDTVRALEMGADDYITKPFSPRELIARIRVNLRRYLQDWSPTARPQPVLEVGPVNLDTAQHCVAVNGQKVDLTVTEFRLLRYLMLNNGVVVSTRAILQQVWGYDDPGASDVVRVAVHRLRRKLGDNPAEPRLIHTTPGVGFMFKPTTA
jgi:two-component system response regulator VicR